MLNIVLIFLEQFNYFSSFKKNFEKYLKNTNIPVDSPFLKAIKKFIYNKELNHIIS